MSLDVKLKFSYKTQKQMDKMMGKLAAYQIAVGRKLCKLLRLPKPPNEMKDEK